MATEEPWANIVSLRNPDGSLDSFRLEETLPLLTDKQIDAIRPFAEEEEIPAAQLVVREGQTELDFLVVLRGAIEFSAADSSGKKLTPIIRIPERGFASDLSLLANTPLAADGRTTEATRNVAQTYAKHFVRHGHEVVLSNSRGPDSLLELVRGIGPNAKAGTVKEVAKQEIVILAVRWEQAKQALAEVSDWKGCILVDATNRPLDEDTKGKTGSEVIASYAPGARLVKALNTIVVEWLQDYSEKKPKTVLFISGDDVDAKRKLSPALEEAGFVPVDIGGLIDGGKLQQFGAPLNALHLDLLNRMEF